MLIYWLFVTSEKRWHCLWYYWGPKRISCAWRSAWQEAFCRTGACAVSARAQELVQYIVRMKIWEKAEGVTWWMEPLGNFLRENIDGPSRDFQSIQWTSRGAPFTVIHPSKAFSQIFILTMYWTSSRARADTMHAPVWQKASCRARQMRFCLQ